MAKSKANQEMHAVSKSCCMESFTSPFSFWSSNILWTHRAIMETSIMLTEEIAMILADRQAVGWVFH